LTTPLLLAELFALFSSISRLFSPKSFLWPQIMNSLMDIALLYRCLEIDLDHRQSVRKVRVSMFAHLFVDSNILTVVLVIHSTSQHFHRLSLKNLSVVLSSKPFALFEWEQNNP
jgi:hypothetical protein